MPLKPLIKIVLLSILSVACISNPKKDSWEKLRASPEFMSEKEQFNNRLNSKRMCLDVGVANFTYKTSIQPDPSCIYPAVMYGKVDEHRYWAKSLKVMQVLNDGFIVTGDSINSPLIFIHKTTETGVVDDSYLATDANEYNFYTYTGPYSYTSLTGTRTVHSFKKTQKGYLSSMQEGLKNYHFLQEVFSELGLWDWADAWNTYKTK